ncbi:MAG: hypothetical protein HQL32_17990, partial [Planctomycetes bacterium]|nr:hypothetical protein [Planctomycetota bacterium]
FGINGLGKEKGSRGPSKITTGVLARIIEYKDSGWDNYSIGMHLGVTEGAVRAALNRNDYSPKAKSLPKKDRSLDQVLANDVCEDVCAEGSQNEVSLDLTVSNQSVSENVSTPCVEEAIEPRLLDRAYARFGLLVEAELKFESGNNLRYLGSLLAFAMLSHMKILDIAYSVYGKINHGFYGLDSIIRTLFLMSILRIRNAEQLKKVAPQAMGRVLGLDRAPEMKTLRRKIKEISKKGDSHTFMKETARVHAEMNEDTMGFLYIDGHVRPYNGKYSIQKAHVTTRNLCMPATTDYWVNDAVGDPVFYVTSPSNEAMTAIMPSIMGEITDVVPNKKVTIVFDRGGWSDKLFKKIIDHEQFELLTYYKGNGDDLSLDLFDEYEFEKNGVSKKLKLAESVIDLKDSGELRLVACLRDDNRQTHILTSRRDLSIVEIAKRMFLRWNQENFFKYMKDQFDLDSIITYDVLDDDMQRLVPNPGKKEVSSLMSKFNSLLKKSLVCYGELKLLQKDSGDADQKLENEISEVESIITETRIKMEGISDLLSSTPSVVPLEERSPDMKILDSKKKNFVDTIKMAAYRSESILFSNLNPIYKNSEKEGRSFLQSVFKLAGDMEVAGKTITIRLESMDKPHRTKALSCLCEKVNSLGFKYPGTDFELKFHTREVKNETF